MDAPPFLALQKITQPIVMSVTSSLTVLEGQGRHTHKHHIQLVDLCYEGASFNLMFLPRVPLYVDKITGEANPNLSELKELMSADNLCIADNDPKKLTRSHEQFSPQHENQHCRNSGYESQQELKPIDHLYQRQHNPTS